MPDQTARQRARRAALDAQSRLRARRAAQERRRSALALTVVTALAERDALVLACETRAGQALHALTTREGLSLREAVAWCGGEQQLSRREASRLRRLETTMPAAPEPADPDPEQQPRSAPDPEPAAATASPGPPGPGTA